MKKSSRIATNYAIAYKMTDDTRVKNEIIKYLYKANKGFYYLFFRDIMGMSGILTEDDFKSECKYYLIKALNDYDHNKGASFGVFFSYKLRQARRDFIFTIAGPHISKARTKKEVKEICEREISVHTPLKKFHGELEMLDILTNNKNIPRAEFDYISKVYDRLSEKQKQYIIARLEASELWGLGKKGHLEQGGGDYISRKIGVCRERNRQLYDSVFNKLRRLLKDDIEIVNMSNVVIKAYPETEKEIVTVEAHKDSINEEFNGIQCEIRR